MALDVRMYTWSAGGLSWSYVMSRLGLAFDNLGGNTYFCSTNGIQDTDPFFNEQKMVESALGLQGFGPGKKPIDIDFCYTVPVNFPRRFLSNSKSKCVIYNFETTHWPKNWKQYYGLADYFFPSSNFSAEIFHMNGVPKEKIFVIPHGVDTDTFNPDIPKVKLRTKKSFRFVSVCAPHHRKNLEALLHSYCQAFTDEEDVCLVLKTKVYKYSDGDYDATKNPQGRKAFEVVIGDIFRQLRHKYGKRMPEIEILGGHVENVSSIYNACHVHVTTTGAEGFFMPGLETMACGLFNIAPRYSGHLDFLNDDNALLIDTKLRPAKSVEQYWNYDKKAEIGQVDIGHTVEMMRRAHRDYDVLSAQFKPHMDTMVSKLSWEYAAQRIVDVTQGKVEHYAPGSYNIWPR